MGSLAAPSSPEPALWLLAFRVAPPWRLPFRCGSRRAPLAPTASRAEKHAVTINSIAFSAGEYWARPLFHAPKTGWLSLLPHKRSCSALKNAMRVGGVPSSHRLHRNRHVQRRPIERARCRRRMHRARMAQMQAAPPGFQKDLTKTAPGSLRHRAAQRCGQPRASTTLNRTAGPCGGAWI